MDLEQELAQLDKEMRFCEVCGELLTGRQKRYCKSLKCKNHIINALQVEKRARARNSFPKYQCQHCGHITQLDYNICSREGFKKFKDFICPNCNTNK